MTIKQKQTKENIVVVICSWILMAVPYIVMLIP
jgi:hypothetical protein